MKCSKTFSDFTKNVIYTAAINEEKVWRKKGNAHDVTIINQLLEQVRELGYNYRYFADITNRENADKRLLKLLLAYIGRFQDAYFSAALVGVVGKKRNIEATERVLKNYMELSNDNKRKYAAFYDNALSKINDKRYLSAYMELLKVPDDAIKLPLTMLMLGKWHIEEAKPHFFEYLNADIFYHNKNISDLVFISLEALSYYHDPDGIIMKALEDKLDTDDKDLLLAVHKAIKRLNKTGCGSQSGDGSLIDKED